MCSASDCPMDDQPAIAVTWMGVGWTTLEINIQFVELGVGGKGKRGESEDKIVVFVIATDKRIRHWSGQSCVHNGCKQTTLLQSDPTALLFSQFIYYYTSFCTVAT